MDSYSIEMIKHDHYTFGEHWHLEIASLDKGSSVKAQIVKISECEAEKMKPIFSHNEKFGKFNENERWF